jgi:N-acetylmuramoyl-L-alanine amidase
MRKERADAGALSRFSLLIFLGALLIAAAPRSSSAMVLRNSWIERRGEVFTIHLRLSGRPRWTLRQEAGRLQIDLANTRTSWSANDFLHAPVGSLGTVRIMSGADGVVVEIAATATCDFVVGRKHDELIVSLAPRGAGLYIAQAFSYARAASPPATGAPAARMIRTEPRVAAAPAPHTAPPQEQIARAEPQEALLPPAVAASAPAVASVPAESEPQVQGRPIVVVDAGHGGFDPGTRSADGVLEKDLALQIARRLAGALARRGAQAVMTRDSDTYLTLAQRTAIANHAGAELFVSVHLNWSSNPQTAGMQVYYLNNTTDRATIRLARMENATDRGNVPADPNLNYILSDLQQQYKATESALLAQTMEQQTVAALQASFGGNVRGLGAKRGPFYVLVGPKIPAVLVECGFLSNSEEAARLANPAYQQALADALADSVVHYLNQDVTAGTL